MSEISVGPRHEQNDSNGLLHPPEPLTYHLADPVSDYNHDSTSWTRSGSTTTPAPCLLSHTDLEDSASAGENGVKASLNAWTESPTDFAYNSRLRDDTAVPFSSDAAKFGMPFLAKLPLGADVASAASTRRVGRALSMQKDALEVALAQLCTAQASALQRFRDDVAELQSQWSLSSAHMNGPTGVDMPPASSPRLSSTSNEAPNVDESPLSIQTEPVDDEECLNPVSPTGRVSVKLAWSSAGLNSETKRSTSLFGKLTAFVRSPLFESSVALLIFCNTIVMALEAQWNGLRIGSDIAFYDEGTLSWHGAAAAFGALEFIFGALFALEFVIKIVCLRTELVWDLWNWLDAIIVAAWFLTEFSGTAADASPVHPSLLRLVRLVRLLRLVRLMHYMRGFDSLLIMTTSMRGSISILCWTGVVLALALMLCALMLQAACEGYLASDAAKEDRELVFMYYGTFTRCFLTMFELTMGNWMPPCRALVENVSEWFMTFFLLHKLIIGFSVLSVVNGVFMQETFKTANLDDHIMLLQKERASKMHKQKMRALFNHLDDDCDGLVSLAEFKAVVHDLDIRQWLSAMEMDVRDVDTVFRLLDADGSQCLTIDELVTGVGRLKGTARAIDVATLLHEEREHWRALDAQGPDAGGALAHPRGVSTGAYGAVKSALAKAKG